MKTNPIQCLLSAFRTLTILSWSGKESNNLSASLPWFPVVGALLGLILYGLTYIGVLLPFNPWHGGVAVIILVAGVWLTRGLHLDGLADWADSMGGSLSRAKRLEIMRDSRIGTFGVLALILLLMAKGLAFERLLASGSFIWVIITLGISRGMMVELITTLPYARPDGGMGKGFVEGATSRHRLISHGFCLILCLPFGLLGFVFWGLAIIITRIFRRRCQKAFGGITGDLLGTANEMVEVVLLVLCAIPGMRILAITGWAWIL